MALAPTLSRKRGMFGTIGQQSLPTLAGGGMGGGQVPADTAMAATEMPRKRGIFGQGGVGRSIAGNVGDFLLQYAGMQPIYQPAMQAQQMASAQEQQRNSQLADWVWKQKWERDNPAPRSPTNFEQILDAAGIQGDERVGLLRRKAENDAAGVPVGVDVQNADGSITRQYVRPGTLGGGSGPAAGSIEDGYRFKGGDPADKNNWEPVGASEDEATAIVSAAQRTKVIAPDALARIQQALGPNGRAAADEWMRKNGITVGGPR